MRVLILGGTAEGRAIADRLQSAGHDVTTSLAGRTAPARSQTDHVITGGFGGPDGLAAHLREHHIEALIDATHPFAARMSHHAATAATATRTPLVRLERPGWQDHPLAGTWHWVADHDEAARAASGRGHALLTVGRQPLPHYSALPSVTARVAEAPDDPPPPGWRIIATTGPFALADERTLLADIGATVLVTKDSGGDHTAAKLTAAHEAGVRVVVVRRPAGPEGVPTVTNDEELMRWLTLH